MHKMNSKSKKKAASDRNELIFNLQWRNRLEQGIDKYTVIGMYDTLSTTSNFQKFKAYLLKNSGVDGDVKVTFVGDNNMEWEIGSQPEFEIAVCAFRLKSRLMEVIHLKLDTIPSTGAIRKKSSANDAETQSDAVETVFEGAPEWFYDYMSRFKSDLYKEINAKLEKSYETDKEQPEPDTNCRKKDHHKKRRFLSHNYESNKDLARCMRQDRIFEKKLEILNEKTKRLREKRQELSQCIGKVCAVASHEEGLKLKDSGESKHEKLKMTSSHSKFLIESMNAEWVHDVSSVPQMWGGETYLHVWTVRNNGKVPWTKYTTLRFTWGSTRLEPRTPKIICPKLQPGEIGNIFCTFKIPNESGRFESHWNFYERNERFGQGLNCIINVIGTGKRSKRSYEEDVLEPTNDLDVMDLSTKINEMNLQEAITSSLAHRISLENQNKKNDKIVEDLDRSSNSYGINEDDLVIDLTTNAKETLVFNKSVYNNDYDDEIKSTHTKCCYNACDFSDEDNNQEKDVLVLNDNLLHDGRKSRGAETNQAEFKKDFDKNENVDFDGIIDHSDSSICEIGSDASSDISSGYDVIAGPNCEIEEDGYVHVFINGSKLTVPRNILHPSIAATAEHAPPPNAEMSTPKTESMETQTIDINKANDSIAKVQHLQTEIDDMLINLHGTVKSHGSTASSYCDANSDQSQEAASASDKAKIKKEEVTTENTTRIYPNIEKEVEENNEEIKEEAPLSPQRVNGRYRLQYADNIFHPLHDFTFQSENSAPEPEVPQAAPQPTAPSQPAANLQILPENLVTGAVNVASSALNTARTVINMIVPQKEQGRWENGHWVSQNPESTRAKNLRILAEMGFYDIDLNATLLARYNDEISIVISELIQ